MSIYTTKAVYDAEGNIVNYCVYKDEIECEYETLSFTNTLKTLKRRELVTLQNKADSLTYWYNYLAETGQTFDNIFTTEEQLSFIDFLKEKINYRKKKSVYVAGSNPYQVGLSSSTIKIHINNIREYYEYLYSHGMTSIRKDCLPFRKELGIVVKNEKNKSKLPETLSLNEVRIMVDACNTYRDKAIILTLVSTGMRLGELCALTMNALDFKNKTIKLKHQYLDLDNGVLKTGERMLKGTPTMFSMIQKYILFERSKVAKCDTLFVTLTKNNGEPGYPLKEKSIEQFFLRLRDKTQIRTCHAHILRHTFASNFLALKKKNDKVTVAVLQKLLGHKNVDTTMIYTHLDYTLDDFRESQEFEELIEEAMKGV